MPILPILLVFRITNSLLTKTFFQADEFWQALEPAHLKAFKYGKLTWEWDYGLRSYAFSLIFELTYRCVILISYLTKILLTKVVEAISPSHFDGDKFPYMTYQELRELAVKLPSAFEYAGVIYGPKIVMAVIAALGEYYTILLVRKIYLLTFDKRNEEKGTKVLTVVKVATILTLSNFFNCFVITRSFINSFEMSMTAISLYYWDWTQGMNIFTKDFSISLFIAIFTCLQRPSNVLIWLTLGSIMIINMLLNSKLYDIALLFLKITMVFLVAILVNTSIDYYFYGKLIFPIFRFIKFNFSSPLSRFYGVAPWHFHLVQSLPILLGFNIPSFIYGMVTHLMERSILRNLSNPFVTIKTVIIMNLIVYSLLSHKEFRFIFPLQPLFTLVSTFAYLKFSKDLKLKDKKYSALLWTIPFISILSSLIVSTFHEAAPIEIMKFLHDQTDADSIGFIMPCHSTPWQSYLHRNDISDLWSISCEPPLHLLEDPEALIKLDSYMDESDYFYDDIPKYISEHFPPILNQTNVELKGEYNHTWPKYLIIFEHLDDAYFREYLQGTNYVEYTRFFNTLSHWDHRRAGDMIVYRQKSIV